MVIPKGYQLHITSWENDGDFEETTIRSGIKSEEDVRFLLALVQAFTSVNGLKPGLGTVTSCLQLGNGHITLASVV